MPTPLRRPWPHGYRSHRQSMIPQGAERGARAIQSDHLDSHRFDRETIQAMGIAFEMARTALRVANRDDLANEQLIANRIIGLAKTGERNPDALCEGAVKSE